MGLRKRPLRVLALVVLVFANVAQAGGPSPWRGGGAKVTPFEAAATTVARGVAGRPVSIECVDARSWRALGDRLGFDSDVSLAVTTFHWDPALAGPAPDRVARFSPRACRPGASFWRDPSERRSQSLSYGAAQSTRHGSVRTAGRCGVRSLGFPTDGCPRAEPRVRPPSRLLRRGARGLRSGSDHCLGRDGARGGRRRSPARSPASTGPTSTCPGPASIRAARVTTAEASISFPIAPVGRRRRSIRSISMRRFRR